MKIIKVETAKDLQELLLTIPDKRIETDQLWKESKLGIDRFYTLLNKAIEKGYIVEQREEFTVYLEASDAD